MKKIINHASKHTKAATKHFKKHGHKYLIGVGALFAIKSMFSLILGLSLFSFQTSAYFDDPATTCSGVTEIPESECVALLNIYNDTNGDSWNNTGNRGNTGSICGSWYGILGCSDNHVSQLSLGNNNLSGSIDLSGLTELTDAWFYDNKNIYAINLSGLLKLQFLNAYGNILSSIDLSGLTGLQSLDLRGNELIEIDLSGLTGLQSLDLRGNELIEINLSGLTGLQSLHLSDNNLSSIDLSSLSGLTSLSLSDNNLSEIDLSSLSSLTRLELGWNNLSEIDLSSLSGLKYLNLGWNNLSEIDLSSLSELTKLSLNNNNLTDILGLTGNINISRGDIRYNYLSSDWITNNESFLTSHNIDYSPQNDISVSYDDEGDLSITGGLFNQRPIYSGTLLNFEIEGLYQGESVTNATFHVGVPFDFVSEILSWVDNYLTNPTTVYGGPGDGCYADFVQGTGDYIAHIDTLLDTAIDGMIDCSNYPGELCTVTVEDIGMVEAPLTHSEQIDANSGMTSRSWILVDVFNLMGQAEGEEHMLAISSGIQISLLSGVAPSSILLELCVGFGSYDLNQCNVLGDLGLDVVPNCGAMVYTNTGTLYNDKGEDFMLIGRYPYIPGGFDVHMFISSEDTFDTDLSNNMQTIHIDLQTGAGTDCINDGRYMNITHGDVKSVYISKGGSCTMTPSICIEGDMYGVADGFSFSPLGHNDFYPDDTCTTPLLPIATNVQIIGDTTIGSTLIGTYDFVYDSIANWTQQGDSITGDIRAFTIEEGTPYVGLSDNNTSTVYMLTSLGEGNSSYQRWRDDNIISGATDIEYTLTSQDAGSTVYFKVVPKTTDGLIGSSVKSSGVYVANTSTSPTPVSPGGGGGSTIQRDTCPENRDCSDSYYDNLCGPCDIEEYEEQKEHGSPEIQYLIQNRELFNQEVAKIKNSHNKGYSNELVESYVFAKDLGITTMETIEKANLEGTLKRNHMAKMISNFAIKTLQSPIDTGANCDFVDTNNQSEEMKTYIQLTCQMGLMGQGIEKFRPNDIVTRAEFGTILSRMLRGDQYEGGQKYYTNHLNALKQSEIMTKIENAAWTQELRGWTMLMMMRIFEKQE